MFFLCKRLISSELSARISGKVPGGYGISLFTSPLPVGIVQIFGVGSVPHRGKTSVNNWRTDTRNDPTLKTPDWSPLGF